MLSKVTEKTHTHALMHAGTRKIMETSDLLGLGVGMVAEAFGVDDFGAKS